jgi:hypothetical protein
VASRPTAILRTTQLPILGTNETAEVDAQMAVWWQNIEPDETGRKTLFVTIPISCMDARGLRHETRYDLLLVELLSNQSATNEIAPGVRLVSRTTTTRSVRWPRLLGNTRRVSVRFFNQISWIRTKAAWTGVAQPLLVERECMSQQTEELDQTALSELSRHYDSVLWAVTGIWTAVIGGLFLYVKGDFDLWLALFGILLTVFRMFFAESFRKMRRHVHARMTVEVRALHESPSWLRQ